MFDENTPAPNREAVETQKRQDARRATVTDAVETLDELHRIIESVANEEVITDTTTALVQATAERELRRAGEVVGREQPSVESDQSPKARLMLTMGRFEPSRVKLRSELESFPKPVS